MTIEQKIGAAGRLDENRVTLGIAKRNFEQSHPVAIIYSNIGLFDVLEELLELDNTSSLIPGEQPHDLPFLRWKFGTSQATLHFRQSNILKNDETKEYFLEIGVDSKSTRKPTKIDIDWETTLPLANTDRDQFERVLAGVLVKHGFSKEEEEDITVDEAMGIVEEPKQESRLRRLLKKLPFAS